MFCKTCFCNDIVELDRLEITAYSEPIPASYRKQSLLRKPRHTKVYEKEKADDRDDESTSDEAKLMTAKTSLNTRKSVTFHPNTRIKKKKAVRVKEEEIKSDKSEDVLSDNS